MESSRFAPIRLYAAGAAVRALMLSLLWWSLTEGDAGAWPFGAAIVLASTAASVTLAPPGDIWWRLPAIARFVPFFLSQSVIGGIDVSRRALHPGLPVNPAFLDYRVALPPGAGRVLFAYTLSLLPGSLSARLDGDRVVVHVIDRNIPVGRMLAQLERHVAAIIGHPTAR
jgi:multicomponent Na+:H+ antiporter subunit E